MSERKHRRSHMNKVSSEKELTYDSSDIFDNNETYDGTEYEDNSIEKPFNPTLINISTKTMSLDTLIKRIREGEVDLSPDFQRLEVWRIGAKSRLIESLLIRIPLPAFYMDATDENKWLVVDGLQRLSTLRDFVIDKTMSLHDLEFLTQFHGFTFDKLPRNYQRRIEETQVTVYQIDKGTPSEVKFNIFKRINTGGLPLTSQEIRHALNQGPVTSYLKELVFSNEFLQATDNRINDKRMSARECALRFHAFTLTPPDKYKAADFDAFLSDAMGTINKMTETERNELSSRFKRALHASHEIFHNSAFRKRAGAPINKALFEVWTVTMDNLSNEQIDRLVKSNNHVMMKVNILLENNYDFQSSVSQATGNVSKVKNRFKLFKETIEECLQ